MNKHKIHLGQKAGIQQWDKAAIRSTTTASISKGDVLLTCFQTISLRAPARSMWADVTAHVNMLLSLWFTEIHWKLAELIYFFKQQTASLSCQWAHPLQNKSVFHCALINGDVYLTASYQHHFISLSKKYFWLQQLHLCTATWLAELGKKP